jgi:hypothetical protein
LPEILFSSLLHLLKIPVKQSRFRFGIQLFQFIGSRTYGKCRKETPQKNGKAQIPQAAEIKQA